jgi:hypothetical protein
MPASKHEVLNLDSQELEISPVLYASMPESQLARRVREDSMRRRWAEKRLGTDDITYVKHMGYVASSSLIKPHVNQLALNISH